MKCGKKLLLEMNVEPSVTKRINEKNEELQLFGAKMIPKRGIQRKTRPRFQAEEKHGFLNLGKLPCPDSLQVLEGRGDGLRSLFKEEEFFLWDVCGPKHYEELI